MPNVGIMGSPVVAAPAGGTAGQVLGIGAGSGAAWVDPAASSPGPLIPVGSWLDSRLTNVPVGAGTQVPTLGSTYYIPIWVSDAMRVDAVGVLPTTGLAGTFLFGLLAADPVTGLPGAMLGYALRPGTPTAQFLWYAAGPFTTPGGSASTLSVPQGWAYVAFGESVANTLCASISAQGAPYGAAKTAGATPPSATGAVGWQATGNAVTAGSPAVTLTPPGWAAPLVLLRRAA
jgi:hypothetical protein